MVRRQRTQRRTDLRLVEASRRRLPRPQARKRPQARVLLGLLKPCMDNVEALAGLALQPVHRRLLVSSRTLITLSA